MKKMKSVFALLLVVAMTFALVACSGDGDTNTTDSSVDTPPASVVESAPAPKPVTVGDVTIEYLKAEKYAPFENGESVLVYCKFTNNSAEETSAYKTLYVTTKCGDQTIQEIDYLKEQRPEGMNDYAKKIAPGESIEFFYTLDFVEGVYEVTIQDLYNQIPEKLVFNIDTTVL